MFFFQAEDGIRDIGVTGVQTCALPIFELVEVHVHVARRREERDRDVDQAERERAAPQRAGHQRLPFCIAFSDASSTAASWSLSCWAVGSTYSISSPFSLRLTTSSTRSRYVSS